MVKLGIAKIGNIVSGLMTDLLLDERADRDDFEAVTVTSGTKMKEEDAEKVVEALLKFEPDLCVVVSPNAAQPGPTKARTLLKAAGKKVVVITDSGKLKDKLEEEGGFGYILINADAMIGARREWLDPIEMAIYNADLMKVLAATGTFRVLHTALDTCLTAIKEGKECELPKIVMTAEKGDKFRRLRAQSPDISRPEASLVERRRRRDSDDHTVQRAPHPRGGVIL